MKTLELEEYLETHYEVVLEIERIHNSDEPYGIVLKVLEEKGSGGLYQLAEELTNKFHAKHKDIEWGIELDWLDTLEKFLKEELK